MKIASSTLLSSTAYTALLDAGQNGVPAWIELLPHGGEIVGRDGRKFRVADPSALVAATMAYNSGRDIVVDFEHATDKAAPEGRPAPAAGWISMLEVRDGAIWGKVSWNETARAMIAAREYRYTSPVFYHGKAEEGQAADVFVIARVGLTNDPNLTLTALNGAQSQSTASVKFTDGAPASKVLEQSNPETSMNTAALCAALGLPATATETEVLTAINAARAAASTTSADMTLYVPKAQHDAIVTELNTVKASQAAAARQAFEVAVNAALDGAIAAGKVVPAAREQYKAMCSDQSGLDNFSALVSKLPVIASAEAGGAAGQTASATSGVLGAEERAACSALGLTEEQFLATKKKEAA